MNLIENKIKYLPCELQFKIINYIIKDYIFDEDSVYFNITPHIYEASGLRISIINWFGTHSPNNYNSCNVLHTIYERNYSIGLERVFSKIHNKIYDKVKRFGFTDDYINNPIFAGTFGPMYKNRIFLNFHILSNTCLNFSPVNKIQYFKDMNLIENTVNSITDREYNIIKNQLYNQLVESVRNAMKEYNINTDNIVKYCGIKEYNNLKKCIFYKINKPISNNHCVIKKNIINKYIEYCYKN